MIHREGYKIIGICMVALVGILLATQYWRENLVVQLVCLAAVIFIVLIIQFFRNPKRVIPILDDQLVYAPADGEVVVIEEVMEDEFFHDKRIQVSIFMSPLNVHVNRLPVGGKIIYSKYHPGKYLVAWHPKSSTENERTTVVIDSPKGKVLVRQIAGAVARRISCYVKEGDQVMQGEEMGFIKFGSRVDIFLPLNAQIEVPLRHKVKGNVDVIARL